jgi:hypothetical protein
MGAPWNTWGGVHSLGTLRDSWKGAQEMGPLSLSLSLWVLCDRNLKGGCPSTGDPEGYVEEGSGDRHLSIRASLGNLEGGSFTGDFERWMRQVCL